eukprot:c10919_g1_i1 orf=286-492(-)
MITDFINIYTRPNRSATTPENLYMSFLPTTLAHNSVLGLIPSHWQRRYDNEKEFMHVLTSRGNGHWTS